MSISGNFIKVFHPESEREVGIRCGEGIRFGIAGDRLKRSTEKIVDLG
jgi:hypothetical protein